MKKVIAIVGGFLLTFSVTSAHAAIDVISGNTDGGGDTVFFFSFFGW